MMEAIQEPISHFPSPTKSQSPTLKKRIYAFYIDLLIIGVISHIMIIGYESVLSELSFISSKGKWLLTSNLHQMKIPVTTFIFWSYFSLSFYFSNGFTFGKKALNLKIQKENQDDLSFFDCAYRSFGYLLCYASFFSLFAVSFLRKDGKGIPDFLSNTACVNAEEFKLNSSKQSEQQNNPLAA